MTESILIGAALAHRHRYGGHAWALLQYVLGFRELGFDVTVVDRLEPGMADDPAAALVYLDRLLAGQGVAYSVLGANGEAIAGVSRAELLSCASRARLFLNVMGFVRDPALLAAVRHRVFLDIDPGFGQLWHEQGLADLFEGHDAFVTVGRNLGRDGCGVPSCGLKWVAVPHPVVLGRCPVKPVVVGPFTSVGSWRGPYGPLRHEGQTLGLRVHEFRHFVDLPSRVEAPFTVAFELDDADRADRDLLDQHGWRLEDPKEVVPDPRAYLRFVQSSLAEFTVAKELYVKLKTGWLGDRTCCYLASGRPALVQDTGLAELYPVGEGLITFATLDDAAAGAESILADPAGHAAASRALAEREFDSRRVLARLLEEATA
jgi:hypothetical protein